MKHQMQGPLGARTVVNGRERDYFAGCGYLGLQNHPAVVQAATEAAQRYGLATATSRSEFGYGDSPIYVELDREGEVFFGAERILYSASSYLGMSILAQGLTERYERIFIDEATHYSGWDGARVTGKPIASFCHLDAGSLAKVCARELKPGERPLVLSDGIFPVSGALAPAPEYLDIVQDYDGLICLDDAHGTGVLGANGRGTLEHYGIDSERCYASHTLSKALGSFGGLIPGSQRTMEELNRKSMVQYGASTPPLPIAAAACQALALARTEPDLRHRLWANVTRAREGMRSLGWSVPANPVPIIYLGPRPGLDIAKFQAELFERDLCIAYVPFYSDIPEGALRIAIFTTHTTDQIDRLVYEMGQML